MITLQIEHAISDFSLWLTAFNRFAARRSEGGVLHERVWQPVEDPHYVFIELEFEALEEAQRFRTFLETQVWSTPANSPALVGSPRARIVQLAPAG
ncbi:MAG: hypothetical protein WB471_01190 [Nocardioides sp.]